MSNDFDVEDLKVHRIEPRRAKGKLHLPVAGAVSVPGPEDDIDEAFGGDGERSETLPAAELKAHIIAALKTIYDPEIPLTCTTWD